MMERNNKNTQEFKLTGKLSQKMAANNYSVILVTKTREEKNPSHSKLVEPLYEEFSPLCHILRTCLNDEHLEGHHGRIKSFVI